MGIAVMCHGSIKHVTKRVIRHLTYITRNETVLFVNDKMKCIYVTLILVLSKYCD